MYHQSSFLINTIIEERLTNLITASRIILTNHKAQTINVYIVLKYQLQIYPIYENDENTYFYCYSMI